METLVRKLINKNNKIYTIFEIIYYVMAVNIIYFLLLLSGLFIFSFTPANITIFQIIKNIKNEYKKDRLKMLKFAYTSYKRNLRKYFKINLVFISIGGILLADLWYFRQVSTMFGYLLSNLLIIMIFIYIYFFANFSFICANYEEINLKEKIKNSIFLIGGYFFDLIIITSFLVGIYLLLEEISFGFIVFTAIGLTFFIIDYFISRFLEGKSIFKIFKSN